MGIFRAPPGLAHCFATVLERPRSPPPTFYPPRWINTRLPAPSLCPASLSFIAMLAFLLRPTRSPSLSPTTPKTRYAAYEYGKYLLPKHGGFRTLFEALQLQECNLETPAEMDTFTPPQFPTPDAALYVSSTAGADSNPGTEASPFKTIAAAVLAAKSGATIVLRKGTYHTDTVLIDAEKNGLTLQNCKVSVFCCLAPPSLPSRAPPSGPQQARPVIAVVLWSRALPDADTQHPTPATNDFPLFTRRQRRGGHRLWRCPAQPEAVGLEEGPADEGPVGDLRARRLGHH